MTKEYEVSYRMYGWYTIKVTADDEDSALELANAMFESVSDEEIVSKTYFEFDEQTDPYIEEFREWNTAGGVKVVETEFDYDLHAFKMSRGSQEIEVVPISIKQMNEMITELDNGACPYNDGWEDGNSNSISDLLDGCKN